MVKQVSRSLSYSIVKKKRQVEIFSIISVILIIICATLIFIALRRNKLSVSEKCGPKFPEFKVKISGELISDGSYRTENGMIFPPGTFWVENGFSFGCPCAIRPCIRKCCPPKHSFHWNNQTCFESDSTLFEPLRRNVFSMSSATESVENLIQKNISDDHFFILHGVMCGDRGNFPLQPDKYEQDSNFLMEDGRILLMDSPSSYLDQSQYCLESIEGNNTIYTNDSIYTVVCFEDQSELENQNREGWIFLFLASGMILSIPFLLVTFIVYALLPQLQNLHGKTLMCHVASLTIAYGALVIVQIGKEDVSPNMCAVLAYITQFTFLASFFWLNAMCFDMWWVFSGLMPPRGSAKEAEHKKFMVYSVYAWGVPLLISTVTGIIDLTPGIPNTFIKPQMAVDRCFFQGFDALVLYFYLPIGVLVCLNFMMFVTTSFRLRTHISNSKVLNTIDSCRHNSAEKQRFNLYLKLFIVMGVTWIMELVSLVAGGSKVIWIFTDLCNTLQGLYIFLIFVCKRRILCMLNKRICPKLELIRPTPSMKYNSSKSTSTRLSTSSSAKLNKIAPQTSDLNEESTNV